MSWMFKRTFVIVMALMMGLSALAFAPGAQAADYGWNFEGDLPTGRSGFLSVELPDGKIFVSMGYDVSGVNFLDDSWLFDPVTMDWTARADSPKSMTLVSGAYLNGRVYVFGGYADPGVPLDSVLVYDVGTNVWSIGQDLPAPAYYMACVAVDDRNILVAGGDQQLNYGISDCYLFNVDTEIFSPADNLPEGRAAGSMAMAGGTAFYFGGWDESHDVVGDVFAYNIEGNEWTALTEMYEPRTGMACAISENGLIYLIGGSGLSDWYTNDNTGDVMAFNPVDGQFSGFPSLPEQSRYGAAVAVGSKMLFFGGHDGSTSRLEIYSLENVRTRAELTETTVEQGDDLWIRAWVDTELELEWGLYGTFYLVQGNTSWGSVDMVAASGNEAYVRFQIPEDLPAGEYVIECYWASLGTALGVMCPLEPMSFTVVEASSLDERLDGLQEQNDDLQDQIDALQAELDQANADLKEAVDAKLDAMIGYVILILVIVVLVVAVISLVRKK